MTLTQVYVDPAIAGDSGTGTVGDPYGDLQYALNTKARDSTNGDQFNVKAGTAEVLAASLSLATYGTPTATAQLVIRGYTSAANDGGMAAIDCNGNSLFAVTTLDYITLVDLDMYSFGDNHGVVLDDYCTVYRCKIHKGASSPSSKRLLSISTNSRAQGCYIYDAGTSGVGVFSDAATWIYGNYLAQCASQAIYRVQTGGIAYGNIVLCSDAGAAGISYIYGGNVIGNIVYNTAAGTASGIRADAAGIYGASVTNNIVVGFSGSGGEGIFLQAGDDTALVGYNAFWNNTSNYTNSGDNLIDLTAYDVALAADPFTDAANGDFSLTTAAQAALRSLGWPASYLGAHANTDPHVTIGTMQYGPTPSYPAVGDVQLGVVYGGGTGTFAAPSASDVRDGIGYGAGGSEFTGTLDLPAVADVQSGVTFDGASKTGTFVAPSVGDVRSGTGYGAGGTEFTGSAAIPAAADVQDGVAVDATTGTFVVPAEADVKLGTDYGAAAEFTGSYAPAGGGDWTDDEKAQIRYRLQLDGVQTAPTDTDLPAVNVTMSAGVSLTDRLAQVDDLPAAAPTAAQVRAEIDANSTQIAAILEDTGTTLDDKLDEVKLVTDAIGTMIEADGATSRFTANALEEAPEGADIFIYTLTYGGAAVPGALVEAYSDLAMTQIIDYGITDAYGKVRLALDLPGTFYLKRTKVGYTFTNPDTEVIL